MAEDFYDSEPEAEVSEAATEEKPDEGPESALLPKSILGGKELKPGEEVVLKIVHIYEDEVEVQYAKAPSPEQPTEETDSPDAQLDKLAMNPE